MGAHRSFARAALLVLVAAALTACSQRTGAGEGGTTDGPDPFVLRIESSTSDETTKLHGAEGRSVTLADVAGGVTVTIDAIDGTDIAISTSVPMSLDGEDATGTTFDLAREEPVTLQDPDDDAQSVTVTYEEISVE